MAKTVSASDRVSSATMATGISYADRTVEVGGDYKRLAFLPFSTLTLEWRAKRVPADVRAYIERDAAKIQARSGQRYQVSQAGQSVVLGGGGGGGGKTKAQMDLVKKHREAVDRRGLAVLKRGVRGIYEVLWYLHGAGEVRSLVNGAMIAEYTPGVGWEDHGRLPDDVREYAQRIASVSSAGKSVVPGGGKTKAQMEKEVEAAVDSVSKGKPARPTPYRIKLTPSELSAVNFARGRYGWADMLSSHAAEDGSVAFTESEMQQWVDDVDADGEVAFPLASPALFGKLESFYGSLV